MKFMILALMFIITACSSGKMDRNMETAKNKAEQMEPSQLDDLIRGEMTAVRTYNQVLEKIKDKEQVSKLTALRKDHENALAKLKAYANEDVKEDTSSAGPWGTFTKAWTGGAKLFGNETAIRALSQGEEHGVREYKEALEDDTINPELKKTIRTELLPKQEKHIKILKEFI